MLPGTRLMINSSEVSTASSTAFGTEFHQIARYICSEFAGSLEERTYRERKQVDEKGSGTHVWAANVVERSEAGYCALAVHDVCYKGPPGGHKPQGGLPSNEYAAAHCTISFNEALQTVS